MDKDLFPHHKNGSREDSQRRAATYTHRWGGSPSIGNREKDNKKKEKKKRGGISLIAGKGKTLRSGGKEEKKTNGEVYLRTRGGGY